MLKRFMYKLSYGGEKASANQSLHRAGSHRKRSSTEKKGIC